MIFFAIDIETTGLDPHKHALCEVGIVVFDMDVALDQYQSDIRVHGNEVDPRALEINKFTPERLAAGADPAIVAKQIMDLYALWLPQGPVICVFQNGPFDVGFLLPFLLKYATDKEMYKNACDMLRRVLDTVSIGFAAWGEYGRELRSLKQLVNEFAPAFNSRWIPHNALSDAQATRIVFQKMMRKF